MDSMGNFVTDFQKIDLRFEDFSDKIYYAFLDEKTSIELRANKKIFDKYGFVPKIKMLNNMDLLLCNIDVGAFSQRLI